MIQIHYLHGKIKLNEQKRKVAMELLDPSHQLKLKRYRQQQDFENGLFSRLLLLAGLSDMGFSETVLPPFSVNDFGKPRPLHKIHFNISHSGDHAVCAITNRYPIGIDTEHIDLDLDLSNFEDIFLPKEWKDITGEHQKFYALWTQKEAVLKAAGTGLSEHPKSVIIDKEVASLHERKYLMLRLEISPTHETHLAVPFETSVPQITFKEWNANIISHLLSKSIKSTYV